MPKDRVKRDRWHVEAFVLESGKMGKLCVTSGSQELTLCTTLEQWQRLTEVVLNNYHLMRKLQGLPPLEAPTLRTVQ